MKIAVTYENGQIFQHFGHTEQFKIYTVEDGKIVSSEDVDITEVAIELSSAELTYEAALMATGKVLKNTLLNFI